MKTKTVNYKWKGEWKDSPMPKDAKAYTLNLTYDIAKPSVADCYVNAVALGNTLCLQGYRLEPGKGYACQQFFLSREALVALMPIIQKHLKRTEKKK